MILGALVLGLGGGLHPDSQSRTLLEVEGQRVGLELEVQVLSLLEVLPDADADGNGRLSPAERRDAQGPIQSYLLEHTSLHVVEQVARWGALQLTPVEVSSDGREWLRLSAMADFEEAVHELDWGMELFLETSPGHLDTVIVRWPDALPDVGLLSQGTPELHAESGPSLRASQVLAGAQVALLGTAWIGLTLLFALSSQWGAPLALAAWFLTSLGAALMPLERSMEPRTLGLASAIVVVYVGLERLWGEHRSARPWELALVGALGGAGALVSGEAVERSLDPGGARLAFALGTLLSVALLAPLGARLVRRHPRAAAALVSLVSLVVFLMRARGHLGPGA